LLSEVVLSFPEPLLQESRRFPRWRPHSWLWPGREEFSGDLTPRPSGLTKKRARGAPPLDRLPSRGFVVIVAAGIGAVRGLGFAFVRPALPKQPEAAALIHSTLVAAGLAAVLQRLRRIFERSGTELPQRPPISSLVRAGAPRIIAQAAVTAAIERWLTHEKLGGHR
jgi:hypothetical protein